MPKNPTLDQRIAWHLDHAAHCGCRDIPPKLGAEIEKRGLRVPPGPLPSVDRRRRRA